MLKRTLLSDIDSLALSRNKMAFISGPRQAGKTTLAKMLLKKGKGLYGNWDDLDFRRLWTKSLHEATHYNNFLLYRNDAEGVKVDVLLKDETIWLSLNQMATLFGINKSGISRHVKNIVDTGELQRNAVVAKIATTATDGKTYQVDFYNLDIIISVGYRVNSIRGTHFRMWATKQLTELIRKGIDAAVKLYSGDKPIGLFAD